MSNFDKFMTFLICPSTATCKGCYSAVGHIVMDEANRGYSHLCNDCEIIEIANRKVRQSERIKERNKKLKHAKKILKIN